MLLKYISIIIGFLLCLLVFWNRLLRTRKSIDLFTEYNLIRICIYACLFIGSFFIVIFFIKKLLNITSKMLLFQQILERPLVISLIAFIKEYILNAPKNLYEWLYIYVKIRPAIDACCKFIQKNHIDERPTIIKIIVISMASFRIVLCLVFIHGVFCLHKLTYFYTCLAFLLIPVLFSIFLYSIKHLATNNKAAIQTFVNIQEDPTDGGWIISRTQKYSYYTDEQLASWGNYWAVYLYAIETIDHYYMLENKTKGYIYIFMYTFYGIGWGYILYRIYLNEYGL
jgi:hypothetical protein